MSPSTSIIQQEPIPRLGMWEIDDADSSVRFAVKHMVVATVRGRFTRFRGAIDIRPSGGFAAAGTVDVSSIDTGDATRDAHLRGDGFFDAAGHPTISFATTEARIDGPDALSVTGNLTIRGQTRPVHLSGSVLPASPDSSGKARMALALTGEVDRAAFGLGGTHALVPGDLAIDRTVTLSLDLSAVRAIDTLAA